MKAAKGWLKLNKKSRLEASAWIDAWTRHEWAGFERKLQFIPQTYKSLYVERLIGR